MNRRREARADLRSQGFVESDEEKYWWYKPLDDGGWAYAYEQVNQAGFSGIMGGKTTEDNVPSDVLDQFNDQPEKTKAD